METSDLFAKLGQLGVTVGLIDATLQANPEVYRNALEGWEEWKESLNEFCEAKIQEAIEFGQAYDS